MIVGASKIDNCSFLDLQVDESGSTYTYIIFVYTTVKAWIMVTSSDKNPKR